MGEIHVESFSRRSTRSWSTVSQRIVEIECDVFGEGAFSPDELRWAFTSRKTLAVLMWEGPGDGHLIGYTQAQPARAADTYYISNTAIATSHQGRGLIKLLMQRLYADIRAAGGRFIERDVAIANGYADMLARVHAADILETSDHDSEYGPQRFIRMRVPDPT